MAGLTHIEALERLRRFGPNAVSLQHHNGPVELFLDTLKSPLVILLLISAGLSGYFGEATSSLIIVAIVGLSSVLDFVNSYRSNKAA